MRRPPSAPQLTLSDLLSRNSARRWRDLARSNEVIPTYSGRAAIYQYFSHLRREQPSGNRNAVLIPAFHCPTVVDPVIHAGYDVRFYAVQETLRVDSQDFLAKLDASVAAAVFIRYFGLSAAEESLFSACRGLGVKVVDDCSHSFLSVAPLRLAQSTADVTTYSFWKIVPTLVGGGLLFRTAAPADHRRPRCRPALQDSVKRLKALSHQLLGPKGGPVEVEEIPRPAVRLPAAEAYPYRERESAWSIPSSAMAILERTDLEQISIRRRLNYAILGEALRGNGELRAVFPELRPDDCPWGFPVLLKDRAEKDYLIRARGVPVFTFGEVLHPALFRLHAGESSMLDVSRFLSNSLLGIAIHQGLSQSQVAGFASEFLRFLSEPRSVRAGA